MNTDQDKPINLNVLMKITVFWDLALWSLVEAYWRFEWKPIFKTENTLKIEAARIYEMSKKKKKNPPNYIESARSRKYSLWFQ
jgi:hypothetical protein